MFACCLRTNARKPSVQWHLVRSLVSNGPIVKCVVIKFPVKDFNLACAICRRSMPQPDECRPISAGAVDVAAANGHDGFDGLLDIDGVDVLACC